MQFTGKRNKRNLNLGQVNRSLLNNLANFAAEKHSNNVAALRLRNDETGLIKIRPDPGKCPQKELFPKYIYLCCKKKELLRSVAFLSRRTLKGFTAKMWLNLD